MSIQKLRIKTTEELENELAESELGKCFGDIFSPVIRPQMPSEEEVMNKINEIIEHINKLEEDKQCGEQTRDIIDFSNVRLPVVEIHRKVRDCSNHKAELIISLDQKTGALTYRVVNKELGYDFVYTPLEFGYVAWTIMEVGEE